MEYIPYKIDTQFAESDILGKPVCLEENGMETEPHHPVQISGLSMLGIAVPSRTLNIIPHII